MQTYILQIFCYFIHKYINKIIEKKSSDMSNSSKTRAKNQELGMTKIVRINILN